MFYTRRSLHMILYQDILAYDLYQEIPNILRAVRPGGGFEFKGDMFEKVKNCIMLIVAVVAFAIDKNAVDDRVVDIFAWVKICVQSHYTDDNADNNNGLMVIFKVDVNGNGEHPIFKHLKAALPLPQVIFKHYSICWVKSIFIGIGW